MTEKVLVRRHSLLTRVTHWINALALLILLMSGLQIFNAHPALYWGQTSTFARPWVAMTMEQDKATGNWTGVTSVGGARFNTTGVLGYSGKPGAQEPRGFPAWATLPGPRSLADGRHWHFFFAWLFVLNGATYLGAAEAQPRLARDHRPRPPALSQGGRGAPL
jgi:thiosulfate reductase cytochrome b subunit